MRVGDIYFKQMDVPDRDYAKAISAEAEYRTMLKQYPDAPPDILKQATQKLREVQEVLATREATIAAFYATHDNWPAVIARYQTVVDTYPQYSHMDDALIGIGDAYEAEAKGVRDRAVCAPGVIVPCLPEGAKAKLEQEFDGKAADAYRNVVLNHSASAHVDDAKERLVSMSLPVPKPTAAQMAASEQLEGSRARYTMSSRLALLILRKPDTVTAAQAGDPPLEDAPATVAPTIVKGLETSFMAAVNPNAVAPAAAGTPAPATTDAGAPAGETPAPAPAVTAAPLAFSDVPTAGNGTSTGNVTEMTPSAPTGGGTGGASLGTSIVSTGGPVAPTDRPAATGAPDANYGLTGVAPKDNSPLPAAEKPADAPDQVNEAAGKNTGPQPTTTGTQKTKSPEEDKNDESSSKKKPKKGLDKLNPF
jgi:outer membrane protein assembly factor BamD